MGGEYSQGLDKIDLPEIRHITGRSGQKISDEIPKTMGFIIVLHDFVNHNLANKIKNLAESSSISMVYARRTRSSIYQKIKECQQQLPKTAIQVLLP